MEKPPQPARHWRQVHRRQDSGDSFNDSIHSNRSSLSSGYNKFSFKRTEENSQKKSAIFHFSHRNRENPHDVSVLTKRSTDNKVQQRKTRDDQYTSHTPRHAQKNNPVLGPVERDNSLVEQKQDKEPTVEPIEKEEHDIGGLVQSRPVMKQIKQLVRTLKGTIQYLNRQVRDLKRQWEKAMKTILEKQYQIQNATIAQLRSKLQQNQKELDRLNRESSLVNKNIFAGGVKVESAINEGSQLALSAIKVNSKNENHNLSRNNTLQSLLQGQNLHNFERSSQRAGKELNLLRQTMKRMQQLLWPMT